MAVAQLVLVRSMTITRFSVALLISLATATCGSAAELPPSVEQVLLSRLDAEKIIEVHDVRQKTIGEFDYLGLFATFEVNSAFERWYHPKVILRKKRSDPNWSQAEFFHSRQRLVDLFALPDTEFQKAHTVVDRSASGDTIQLATSDFLPEPREMDNARRDQQRRS